MTRRVMMDEISWTEYQRRLNDEDPIIGLPVGALEQHGPHLPMGTDAMIAREIAKSAALAVNMVVAPAFAYGYKSQPKSGGGNHFCGTTSLDGNNLSLALRDVLNEFARHGARKIALFNGHYENTMFIVEGVDLALRDLRYDGIDNLKVMKIEYCEFISEATLDKVFTGGFPGWPLEHAAVMETSVMLHLHPELVNVDEIPDNQPANFPPYDIYPTDTELVPWSGALSSAKPATAEKGRLMYEEFVAGIVEALRQEFEEVAERERKVSHS